MRYLCVLTALLVSANVALGGGDNKRPQGQAATPEQLKTLIGQLNQGNDTQKIAAVTALADLGPAAAPAVPALVKLFTVRDEYLRLNAAVALGKVGKAAVPALTIALTVNDADVRYYALSALGWVGADGRAATKAVIDCLADKNEGVRRKAAYALGKFAAEPDDTVAALVKLLGDPNGDVRLAVGDALAKFGAKAVPTLLRALDDKDIAVRVGAIRALGGMGPDAKEAVPQLGRALLVNDFKEFNKSGVSAAAAEALAKIGKAGLRALNAGVKSQHADVRRLAVEALGKAGADAVPLLVDALGDANVDVRRRAAEVLGPMRVSDKMVVLGLAYALKDSDSLVRFHAVRGLLALGAGAKPATPQLLDGLKSSDPGVQSYALRCLLNVKPDTPEVFKKLRQLAQDDDASARGYALMLLTPYGAEAMPLFLAGLKDGNAGVRRAAVNALRRHPGDLREALPLLLPLLKSEDATLRQITVHAVSRTGAAAVPHLIEMLKKDANLYVRLEAANGLAAAGPAGQKALLAAARDHADRNVQMTALQMLTRPKTGVAAEDALPFLIACVKNGQPVVRNLACHALGNYGAAARNALPALNALAGDQTVPAYVRNSAQAAVKRIQAK